VVVLTAWKAATVVEKIFDGLHISLLQILSCGQILLFKNLSGQKYFTNTFQRKKIFRFRMQNLIGKERINNLLI